MVATLSKRKREETQVSINLYFLPPRPRNSARNSGILVPRLKLLAVYAKTLPCPEEEEGEEEEEEIADPVRSRKTYVFSIDRVSVSYAISYEIIYVRICTVRPFFLEGV